MQQAKVVSEHGRTRRWLAGQVLLVGVCHDELPRVLGRVRVQQQLFGRAGELREGGHEWAGTCIAVLLRRATGNSERSWLSSDHSCSCTSGRERARVE